MKHPNNALFIATGVGLILSDIIPTPADALYFNLTAKWKNQLEDGMITPKQYWTKNAVAYYGLNPIWWSLVVGSSIFLGKSIEQKFTIFIALLSGGALVGVLGKNIKNDVSRYEQL
jgi:uncharacterized membrane protein YkvI